MLFFIILSLFSDSYSVPKPSDVVATVNGTKITFEEFDESYKQNLYYVSDKLVTKKKVLEDLINREIGIQVARKNKLDSDPVVRKKLEDILYHAQISKDLEDKLQAITVADDEVKEYYKKFPEYRTSHILFRVRVETDEKETTAAMEESMKVYNTAKDSPEKFAELANKFSQSANSVTGGDIGFQPAVQLAPEYFAAIKGKSNGFITPPVRTQFGYHVIKVMGVKDVSEIDLPLYKKIVYDRKRDDVINAYFQEQRKKASITINDSLIK